VRSTPIREPLQHRAPARPAPPQPSPARSGATHDAAAVALRGHAQRALASVPPNTIRALQRAVGNAGVASALGAPGAREDAWTPAAPLASVRGRAARVAAPPALLQRKLDDDFKHGGVPTDLELAACQKFATIVSDLVDQAHLDLLAGKVADWRGAKITAFLGLLGRGSPAALVHVGNAIEERVYALMKKTAFDLDWVPQFDEAMGGSSFPDIVVHLDSLKRGLIDITSDRGHVLGKGGSWTTSTNYVYVAEVWFPSVFAEHLPDVAANVKAGGVGQAHVAKMVRKVEREREARRAAHAKKLSDARERRNEYTSYTAFVREEFDGDKTAADAWMRDNGLGNTKGVGRRAKRRAPDYAQKARRRRAAQSAKRAKMTTEELAAEKLRKSKRAEELKKDRKRVKRRELQKGQRAALVKMRRSRVDVEEDEESELEEEPESQHDVDIVQDDAEQEDDTNVMDEAEDGDDGGDDGDDGDVDM
jgi:hypothetical protein